MQSNPKREIHRRTESGERPIERESFVNLGTRRLVRLCEATGLERHTDRILAVFTRLLAPWGQRPVEGAALWPSEVGDDYSPYEFSVAFGPRPELRILVEPLGSPPSLGANAEQSLVVLRDLASDHPISMDRFEKIRDLFLPEQPQGLFSLWIAVSFTSEKSDVKLYLNPEAQGVAKAPALVEEAMVRLGFPRAWGTIADSIGRRGRELDEIKYFSLDLKPTNSARVKVYARHLRASVEDVERAAQVAQSHRAGDVTEFVRAMMPDGRDVFDGRPPATCLAFVEGQGEAPAAVTHYFPTNGGYSKNDGEAARRIRAYMESKGQPVAEYDRALAAVAERRLEDGIGLQSYASLRRHGEQSRVTVYYAPELYRPGMIATADVRPAPRTPEEVVKRFEEESIADHPFMRRLRREPVDLYKLWKLMANAQIGIVNAFARRLSQVVAKVEDDRIRSILAGQLNDELGGGRYERAHSQLFAKLVEGLSRWKPERQDESMFVPGRGLSDALESIYHTPDAMEGVGATMVIEIFGRQVDLFLGDEFRRQKEVDPQSLEWLNMHEELEVNHSAESLELAYMVPADALPSVWRGAARVGRAGTAFFDAMYRVAFQ